MTTAVVALVAFLLGSVPFGFLAFRWLAGGDLRATGSGNVGATNVARSLGLKLGLCVLLLDAGKGAAAALLGRRLEGSAAAVSLAAVAAVAGHVFSPWLRFRGGKGVATTLGAFAVLSPSTTLVACVVMVLVVAATRYVSLGSLVATGTVPALLVLGKQPGVEVAAAVAVWGLIVARHGDNIRRLRAGTESRFPAAAGRSSP